MSSHSGSNGVDQHPDSAAQTHQKRSRIQLSCTLCRQSKLKCDRGQPCNQCIRKDKTSMCVYAAVPVKNKPSRNMRNRLHHLESLVKDLMNEQTNAKGVSPSGTSRSSNATDASPNDPARVNTNSDSNVSPQDGLEHLSLADPHGQVIVGKSETTYVGATHWAGILDDIEEVKGYFNDEQEDELEFQVVEHGQSQGLGLGVMPSATRASVLAALPSQSVADRLVYRYFNSNDPALYIIHKPTFQKEYQRFWANPENTPLSWIGLLCSMMALASFFSLRAGEQPLEARGTPMEMVAFYRTLCSQCLILANYSRPGPYILEAFALYSEGEFIQTKNSQVSSWLLTGLAVRLGLRMGYHRDPKTLPALSPYQGEMRRRVWHLLAQVDILLSFHVGLPTMMTSIQTDTEPPRNLYDDDFGEDSVELPASRPFTEYTPMLYVITKSGLMGTFGRIVEQVNSLVPPSYKEVMALDTRLQEAYTKIPPLVMIKPISQSLGDSPNSIIQRFNLITLFHKSRCMLHRKYLFRENSNHEFRYSDESCMDSAMELLHYQSEVNEAIKPGGPLNRDRWYVGALAMHDFLLAAMIIYLRLNHTTDASPLPDSQRQHMTKILEKSRDIFREWGSETFDASKAAKVLDFILRNIENPGLKNNEDLNNGIRASKDSLHFGNTIPAWAQAPSPVRDKSIHYSHYPVEPVNNTPPNLTNFGQTNEFQSQSLDDLAAMIDMPMNLDWETWDNRVNSEPQPVPQFPWPTDMNFDTFGLPDDQLNINSQFNMQG